MADYRATPEQWDALEECTHAWPGAWGPCILELRARVEALEAGAALSQPALQKPTLEEVDDLCAKHSFFYEDSKSLEHLQLLITDALARWGSPAKPTPNDRQIRSSLVERVAAVIADPDLSEELWLDDARAVIHEVAEWLRDEYDDRAEVYAVDLEQEAEHG